MEFSYFPRSTAQDLLSGRLDLVPFSWFRIKNHGLTFGFHRDAMAVANARNPN